MNNFFKVLNQNNLSYRLVPISIRELLFLETTHSEIYGLINGLVQGVVPKGTAIGKEKIVTFIQKGLNDLYVNEKDYKKVLDHYENKLVNSSRSLSMGNHVANATKQINYLLINLNFLYRDPLDDNILFLQLQSVKNLISLLVHSPEIIHSVYEATLKQSHHYLLSQALLSSLILLGYLQSTQQFSPKEVELLFITSYFKDIGMSLLSKDQLDKKELSNYEKKIIANHGLLSYKLLAKRLPIPTNYLELIKNHNKLSSLLAGEKDSGLVIGVESFSIGIADVLTAMTTDRPYQDKFQMFKALEEIKKMVGKELQSDFKLFVNFLYGFFKD